MPAELHREVVHPGLVARVGEGVAAVESVGGSDVRSPPVGSLVRSRGYCSGVDPADFSRSVIASRLSTWKPMWWMPLQPLPRSTPATASFLKLRIARLMSPSLR